MENTITFTKTKKQIIAVIFALGEIGKSVIKQSFGDVANSTVALPGETRKVEANKKLEDATLNAELLLQDRRAGVIENNLKETISARLSGDVGRAADRQRLERVLLQAVNSLETIKFGAEDRYLMNASIIAEVALMHFESLDLEKLEEKINENFRGKRRFTYINEFFES